MLLPTASSWLLLISSAASVADSIVVGALHPLFLLKKQGNSSAAVHTTGVHIILVAPCKLQLKQLACPNSCDTDTLCLQILKGSWYVQY